MKSGTRFCLSLTMCFFSSVVFAGLEELKKEEEQILEEMQSIEQTLEVCRATSDDTDDVKRLAQECRQTDLLILRDLQFRLEEIREALLREVEPEQEPEPEQELKNVDTPQSRANAIKKAQEKIERLNHLHTEALDRHYQNLDDEDEYTPDLYEDANELLSMRNSAIEELRMIEQQINETQATANAGGRPNAGRNSGTVFGRSR